MSVGGRHWRRPLVAAALAASALGWSACEPLDLALFPEAPDASAPAPPIIEVPGSPAPSEPADAGSDVADAGSTPPEPPPCQPGESACEACVLADECLAGEVCHPATGECVPPCASGTRQCPPGLVCGPLDVCVQCASADQCAAIDDDLRCDLARGACVECITSADCTDDPFERPVCLPGGTCGCASDADCSGGAICELDEAHCEIEDD
jgi:hypothetical protein